ncbi:MAG: hypothetical protein JF609_03470 [Verrucomicrobia bacterium]|nr:hypothetical protein [Verrucomicrobiota bacterium]
MSLWRKEASERLPELQQLIASRDIDNPMMLWTEIKMKFQDFCEQEPPPLDLIKRVWGYAKWCMAQGHEDVATAAALCFCEHLLDRKATQRILPQIMTRQEYEGLKGLLLYHKSEEDFAKGLKLFEEA